MRQKAERTCLPLELNVGPNVWIVRPGRPVVKVEF